MAISLHDATVQRYAQTLEAAGGFLEKGAAHARETGTDPGELVQARLFPDMLPLLFQVHSLAHHSIGAIEGVKKGVFLPPGDMPAADYAGLQAIVADTRDALSKITAAEVDALAERDVVFQFRDFKMPFTGAGFLLSFSLPNFFFHAATAYDILRSRGVPLGKRDFMGPVRLKS